MSDYKYYECKESNEICITTKTIIYKCGCKVLLGNFGKQETGHSCSKHMKGIKKIVTEETFI